MTLPNALFLYAITRADGPHIPAGTLGLNDTPLRYETVGPLSAIVSFHDAKSLKAQLSASQPEQLQPLAIAYHHTLNGLSKTIDLLPARFGTALPDCDALAAYLKRNEAALQHSLSAITGKLEWTIRLKQAQAGQSTSESANPRDYLRARHTARQDIAKAAAARADIADTFAAQLASAAPYTVLAEAVSPDLAAAGCFASLRALCPRGEDDAVLGSISALIRDVADVHVDVIGPEAPYRFSSHSEAAPHA